MRCHMTANHKERLLWVRGRRSLTTWMQPQPNCESRAVSACVPASHRQPHPKNNRPLPPPLAPITSSLKLPLAKHPVTAKSSRHLSGLLTRLLWGCDPVDQPSLGSVFSGLHRTMLPCTPVTVAATSQLPSSLTSLYLPLCVGITQLS